MVRKGESGSMKRERPKSESFIRGWEGGGRVAEVEEGRARRGVVRRMSVVKQKGKEEKNR